MSWRKRQLVPSDYLVCIMVCRLTLCCLLIPVFLSLLVDGFRVPEVPLPRQEAVDHDYVEVMSTEEDRSQKMNNMVSIDKFRNGGDWMRGDDKVEKMDTLIPPVVPIISNVTQAVLGPEFNVTKEMMPQQDVGYENKNVHPMFTYMLKIFGPFFFIALQCASVLVALDVWKARSTSNLSPLPFLSQVVNCVVWGIYGLLRHDVTIFWPNFVGFWAGLFAVFIYHRFCRKKPIFYYGVFSLPFLACMKFARENNDFKVGVLGCTLAVIVSGAPLATIKTVVTEKSTAALPLLPSVFTWMNAFCWYLYGYFIVDDIMIYGPNSMGIFLASLQIFLYILYGFPPSYSHPLNASSTIGNRPMHESISFGKDGDSSEPLLVKPRKPQEHSNGNFDSLCQN